MKRLTTVLLSAAVSFTALAQPQLSEKNIDKVLKAMTLEEKAQLLVGSIEGMNYTGVPLPPTGDEAGYQRVPGAAGQTNTIPRLGIPPTVVADGPAGLRITPHRVGSFSYFPMRNFEFIDNQLVVESVVEMWYTTFVNNSCVTVQICIIGLRQ
ncbi:MAG: hypothetical protein IJP49_04105 [Bacteroidales bacterium]|nr:hypothetical protein [Bacteroidales bacterium]